MTQEKPRGRSEDVPRGKLSEEDFPKGGLSEEDLPKKGLSVEDLPGSFRRSEGAPSADGEPKPAEGRSKRAPLDTKNTTSLPCVEGEIARREEEAEVDRTAATVETERILIRERRDREAMERGLAEVERRANVRPGDEPHWKPFTHYNDFVYRLPHDFAAALREEYIADAREMDGGLLAALLNLTYLQGIEVGCGLMKRQATDLIGLNRALREEIAEGEDRRES